MKDLNKCFRAFSLAKNQSTEKSEPKKTSENSVVEDRSEVDFLNAKRLGYGQNQLRSHQSNAEQNASPKQIKDSEIKSFFFIIGVNEES